MCSPRAPSSPSPARRSPVWTQVALGQRAGPARIAPCSSRAPGSANERAGSREPGAVAAHRGFPAGRRRARAGGVAARGLRAHGLRGDLHGRSAGAHPHHGAPRARTGAAGRPGAGPRRSLRRGDSRDARRPGARRARAGGRSRGRRNDPRGAGLAARPHASQYRATGGSRRRTSVSRCSSRSRSSVPWLGARTIRPPSPGSSRASRP